MTETEALECIKILLLRNSKWWRPYKILLDASADAQTPSRSLWQHCPLRQLDKPQGMSEVEIRAVNINALMEMRLNTRHDTFILFITLSQVICPFHSPIVRSSSCCTIFWHVCCGYVLYVYTNIETKRKITILNIQNNVIGVNHGNSVFNHNEKMKNHHYNFLKLFSQFSWLVTGSSFSVHID